MASLYGSRDLRLSKMPHKIDNYNIPDNLFIRVPTLFWVGLLYVECRPIKTVNADLLINNNDMDNTSNVRVQSTRQQCNQIHMYKTDQNITAPL